MKIAPFLLMSCLITTAAAAQAARDAGAALNRSSEKPSLCIVGKAPKQHDALVPLPQHEPTEQEMAAIADALLNCSPAEMKANQAPVALPVGTIALGADMRSSPSIPTGNG